MAPIADARGRVARGRDARDGPYGGSKSSGSGLVRGTGRDVRDVEPGPFAQSINSRGEPTLNRKQFKLDDADNDKNLKKNLDESEYDNNSWTAGSEYERIR